MTEQHERAMCLETPALTDLYLGDNPEENLPPRVHKYVSCPRSPVCSEHYLCHCTRNCEELWKYINIPQMTREQTEAMEQMKAMEQAKRDSLTLHPEQCTFYIGMAVQHLAVYSHGGAPRAFDLEEAITCIKQELRRREREGLS